MNRRTLLASLSGAAVPATTGCTGPVSNPVERVKLGAIWIGNDGSSEREFNVQVKRGGTLIHSSDHTLSGSRATAGDGSGGSSMVTCTWEEKPARYTVRAGTEEDGWEEVFVNDRIESGASCVWVDIWYHYRSMEGFTFLVHPDCEELVGRDEGCDFATENAMY